MIEVMSDYDKKAYQNTKTFYFDKFDKSIIEKELKKIMSALDK